METTLERGNLSETPFNIIQSSEILTKEDLTGLRKMTGELKNTFLKTQTFRTRTEMEVSVLNNIKYPTASSKYWQSMREQNVMFHELVMLSYEYRKNIVEIKMLQLEMDEKIDTINNTPKELLEIELLQIEKEKKMFVSKNHEKIAKARIVEIKNWSKIKEREAAKMSETELADVDFPQLISYTKRWINQSRVMGGNGSPAERQNLLGQLSSGITLCISKGIINDVFEGFNEDVIKKIKAEYGIE